MKFYELYEEFERKNYTSSQRSFSRDWLGKSETFLAQKKYEDLTPDIAIPLWRTLTGDVEPDHELAAKVLLAVLEKGGDEE
jgi:hypothetical protein